MAKSIFAASKPEHILCAAIHYPNEQLNAGMVHKCQNVDKGIVLCGWRHHNVINLYWALTGKKTSQVEKTQGFLTSKNRFVDREEAFAIAVATGQVSREQIVRDRQQLHSEDLY